MANSIEKRFPPADDLRTLSDEELAQILQEKQKELVLSRFKHASARLEKTSDLKLLRRTIARIQTVITERRG